MSTLEKGFIPCVVGGLGNQMFIIAAAYACHRYSKAPLYILQNPVSNNKHNRHSFNYLTSIFKYIGVHLSQSRADSSFLHSLGYQFYRPSGFAAWNPADVEPGTLLDSYFQYYPAIKPYEDDLRCLFLRGLQEFVPTRDYSASAFLHIRRGDYLQYSSIHYIQPLEYYMQAVALLPDIYTFVVVSDDVEWVESQEYFKDPKFEIVRSANEVETLALMSQCKAAAICANSTFSWWGAFLGAYSAKNPVIVPAKWISLDIVSLFPEEWISI